jgi:hypothetical protein
MYLTITESVFIAKIKTVLNQPVSVVDTLCRPFGAGVIAECTLLRAVWGAVCLVQGSVVVIPLGGNDGEHLATLQGHFNNVLVGKTDGTLCRKFVCYEDVNSRFLNSLVFYYTN